MTPWTPELVDWLASTLGSDGAAHASTQLPASTSSVFALDGDLVLRWYDDRGFLAKEPDAIPREAAALTVLAGSDVPAPRLIAASVRAPVALLMTRVPGSPSLAIPSATAVGDLLGAIHAVPPGPLARWSYHGYHENQDLIPPAWWRDARTWERAVRQTTTARPTGSAVLIHRDFHPGNILWTRSRVTGIVDWVNACLGPAEVDTAHMRVNMAVLGDVASADRILPGDPAWDIEAAFGFLDWGSRSLIDSWPGPWPALDAATARAGLEAFVAGALARLADGLPVWLRVRFLGGPPPPQGEQDQEREGERDRC